MIFKPESVSKMWDTWMYFHEGTYYLYYLITERGPGEGVGLATSPDGVHWQDQGWVLRMAEDALWLGSGAVWKSSTFEENGKFIMNFSEWRGPQLGVGQQTIFFAESTDLMHWQRLGAEFEFSPDGRYYRVNEGDNSRWDCICPIPRPGGGYYGYWTANPNPFYPGFGFGETLDGLHWQALPAPTIEWGQVEPFVTMEAGAVEKISGRYYAMLGTYHPYGDHSRGMFTFSADQPQGPYRPVETNFALLTSPVGLNATYFSRFFPSPQGVLVNHHSITRLDERTFAPMKRALVDAEGVLRLAYWEGNDALKGEALLFPQIIQAGEAMQAVRYDLARGMILEGEVHTEDGQASKPEGFLAGFALENEDATHTLIRIHSNSRVSFGVSGPGGENFREESGVDRELGWKDTFHFRILLRGSLLEVYIDDYLMQCFSVKEKPTGRIAVVAGVSRVTVREEKAFMMTLEG